MDNRLVSILLFTVMASLAAHAQEVPPNYRYGLFKASGELRYLNSSDNFTESGGEIESIANGGSLEALQLDGILEYSFAKRWNARGLLRYAYVKTSDGSLDRENSDVTDLGATLQYKLSRNPFYLIPQFRLQTPLRSVDRNTDEAIINNGALEFEVGSWAKKKLSLWKLEPFLYLGYLYRSEGLSHLLNYKIGLQKKWRQLHLGFSYKGFESVSDDEFAANKAERHDVLRRVNGGSFTYYSTNPALSALSFLIKYRFNNTVALRFNWDHRINGTSSAAGDQIMLALDLSFYTKNKKRRRQRRRKGLAEEPQKDFTIESQRYDENLFEEDAPQQKKRRNRKKRSSSKPESNTKSIEDYEKEVEKDLLDEAESLLDN